MTEMVESSLVTVALSCRIDQGEGAKGAGGRRVIPVAVEEAVFQRTRYFCGEADTDEAAGVVIANDPDGIRCRNDLAPVYFHPVAIILRRMNAICVDSGSCFGHTS